MAQVIKEIQLEVSKPNFIQAIVAKQYDNKSRYLRVQLVDNGEKITVKDTSSVVINARRSDGGENKFRGTVDAGQGTVLVPLTYWMLELEGRVTSDVSVYDADKILTTTNFTIEVERASCQNGSVSVDDADVDVLTQLILEVQNVKTNYDVKHTYDPNSTNAISGQGVAEALTQVKIDVDPYMSDTSTNPVQNKVVRAYIDGVASQAVSLMDAKDQAAVNAVTKYVDLGDKTVKDYVDDAVANVKITADDEMSDTSENPVQNKVAKDYVDSVVSDIETSVEEISSILDKSVNIYDESKNTDQLVINASGVETVNGQYVTTDYILLDVGSYTMTYDANGQRFAYMAKYDLDKKFKSRSNVSSGSINITEPCYVRFSGTRVLITEIMLVAGTELPAEYVPYKKTAIKSEYIPTDQTFDATSSNPQSGVAIDGELQKIYVAMKNTEIGTINPMSIDGAVVDNFYNPDTATVDGNYLIGTTGIKTANSSYMCFKVNLFSGKSYRINIPAYSWGIFENNVFEGKATYYGLIGTGKAFEIPKMDEKVVTVFISCTITNFKENVIIVEGENLPTGAETYNISYPWLSVEDINGSKITDESMSIHKTAYIKTNSNLFNHRNITGGYYLNSSSVGKTLSEMKVVRAIYGYSDKIYLKPSTTYTCKDIFRIHLFDVVNGTVIQEMSYGNDYNVSHSFTTPDYETYAMMSVYIAGNYSFEWQLNEGEELLDYEKQQISICGYTFANETDNVGGFSEIKNWNKVVIDKSTPFALSEDVADYEYKTSTSDMISLYDNLMSENAEYITKTTETVTTATGTQTFTRYDFVEPNLDENGNKHFEQNKTKIILSSGTHPERSGIYGLFYAMREITNNPDLINIRRNCHFIVIPVLNPYGVDNGDRRNANKVDIARNFEVDWFEQEPTNDDGTENGTYGGTTFLTEPESVYLDGVLKENKDAIFYVSCHSFQRGVTIDSPSVSKGDLFMWCASSTNYVNNIGGKVADKVSRVWRNKYGDITFENGNNLVDKPSTLLGTSNTNAPGGSEGKQAIKYGIQGCTFEVCDWCRFNDNRQSEGYMTQFVVSRACEVYVNLIATVVDCYDYLDKKLL